MKILFTFIAAIISVYSVSAQGLFDRHPDLVPFTKDVNSDLASMEKVVLDNEHFLDQPMDGGIELVGYFKKNEIQKISISVGLSYGNQTTQFYFKDSKLYYVNETFDQFEYDNKTGSLNYSVTETVYNGHYLFSNPFDSESLGHGRFEADELDPEETLQEEAAEYLTKINETR
jgi:hypothetical protein